MTAYTLPDLPYDYSALEPNYSARIVELHHDKHHAAYVKQGNAALDELAAGPRPAEKPADFEKVRQILAAV